MTSSYLFEFTAGDDYALEINMKDSQGVALNLAGHIFQATLKLDPRDSDEDALVKVYAYPVARQDGLVVITYPHDQTANLLPGKYHMDIQMVSSNGTVRTLLVGRVEVKLDITIYKQPAV